MTKIEGPWQLTESQVLLFSYWLSRRQDNRLPRRADLEPLDFYQILPQIYLLDVLGPGRYRYRLVGTAIATTLGYDSTGRTVDDRLFPGRAGPIIAMYDHVVEAGEPVVCRSKPFESKVDFLTSSSLSLPLADDGKHADMIIGAMDFHAPVRLDEPDRQGRSRQELGWRSLDVSLLSGPQRALAAAL